MMEACLVYFRKALAEPESVPPWEDWWAEHRELVENTFSLVDYVRLKHRGLIGAEQILRLRGLTAEQAPTGEPAP